MKIGFIGLGIMGRPMALNLLKGGHEVVVWARRAESMAPLSAAGAAIAANPADVARQVDVVISMVADAPDVEEVVRRFHKFAEGAVLIAHNAPFDMGLLRAAEGETRLHFPNRVMDTVLLSAMIWGQSAPHSLDAICARLGITIPEDLRHTAMGDAEATAQAFLRMIPALEAKGITRFDHVLRQAQKYRRLLSDANLAAAHGH